MAATHSGRRRTPTPELRRQRQNRLLAGCVIALGLCSCDQPEELAPFGLAEAERARLALAALPAAEGAFRKGDYAEASRQFEAVLAQLPELRRAPAAAALLGLESAAGYRQLVARLRGNLGLTLFRSRAYTAAAAELEAAIRIDPSLAGTWHNLGLVRLQQRRYPEALTAFEAARERGADGVRLWLELGRSAWRSGDLARARAALARASHLSPASPGLAVWGQRLEAVRLLAELDLEEGRTAAAERRLRSVLSLAPGEAQARFRLVQLLERSGRPEEAAAERQVFERSAATMASIQGVLAASPGRVEALRWVADAYRGLGLLHLAEARYRQLLARDPQDGLALLALSALQARVESLAKAGELASTGATPGATH